MALLSIRAISIHSEAHMRRGWGGVGLRGGWGKPLMSFKTRSRFSYCGTPLSVRAISIHSEAHMRRGWGGMERGMGMGKG